MECEENAKLGIKLKEEDDSPKKRGESGYKK